MKGKWDYTTSDVCCVSFIPPQTHTHTLVFPLQLTETAITQMNGGNSKTFLLVYSSTEVLCAYDSSETNIQIRKFKLIVVL
jgi:hypothetical protein